MWGWIIIVPAMIMTLQVFKLCFNYIDSSVAEHWSAVVWAKKPQNSKKLGRGHQKVSFSESGLGELSIFENIQVEFVIK